MTTHLQSLPAQTEQQLEQSELVTIHRWILERFLEVDEAMDERGRTIENLAKYDMAVGCIRRALSAPLSQTAPQPEQSQAAADVLAERRRQIEAEGWTPEHDDAHNAAELSDAAACYALWAGGLNPGNWSQFWPWGHSWLKHSEPRRMLVKAGALILAEIERLDRLQTGSPEGLLRSAQGGAE